jgi:hypothetical protein
MQDPMGMGMGMGMHIGGGMMRMGGEPGHINIDLPFPLNANPTPPAAPTNAPTAAPSVPTVNTAPPIATPAVIPQSLATTTPAPAPAPAPAPTVATAPARTSSPAAGPPTSSFSFHSFLGGIGFNRASPAHPVGTDGNGGATAHNEANLAAGMGTTMNLD